MYMYVCLSFYLSIYLSVYLSLYLSIYLSVYLSIYLSTYLQSKIQTMCPPSFDQSSNGLMVTHDFGTRIYIIDSYFKNFVAPFYGLDVGQNCFKTTEPLRGDSLPFTTKSPGVPGTHLTDFGRMKVD